MSAARRSNVGEYQPRMASDQNEVRVSDVGTTYIEPFYAFVIPCERNVFRDEMVIASLTYKMQQVSSLSC